MKAVCKFILRHMDDNALDTNGVAVNVLDSNPEETNILFAGAWPLAIAKGTNNNNRSEKIRGFGDDHSVRPDPKVSTWNEGRIKVCLA